MPDAVAVVTIMFTDIALVTIMSVGTMAAAAGKYGVAARSAASGAVAIITMMVTTVVGQDITDEARERCLAGLEVGTRSVCLHFARFGMTTFGTENLVDNDRKLLANRHGVNAAREIALDFVFFICSYALAKKAVSEAALRNMNRNAKNAIPCQKCQKSLLWQIGG